MQLNTLTKGQGFYIIKANLKHLNSRFFLLKLFNRSILVHVVWLKGYFKYILHMKVVAAVFWRFQWHQKLSFLVYLWRQVWVIRLWRAECGKGVGHSCMGFDCRLMTVISVWKVILIFLDYFPTAEISTAVRKTDMRLGLYHSLFEWYNPLYKMDAASGHKTQLFVKVSDWCNLKA